jgi:hypothetical protein
MLNVLLKNKVVGYTELGKTQRMTGLLCAFLRVMSYNLNIYSAKIVVILCCVEIPYFVC